MHSHRPNIIIGILLLLLAACNPAKQAGQTRVYKSAEPAWPDFFTYGTHIFSVGMGSMLTLYPDSTFEYKTCGNFSSGHWKERGDSLYLYQTFKKWNMDSLNKADPLDPKKYTKRPVTYKIVKNRLIKRTIFETPDKRTEKGILIMQLQ